MSAESPWLHTIESDAADDARTRLDMLDDTAIKARRVTADLLNPDPSLRWWWIGGDRSRLNAGLQRLVMDTLGTEHRWLIQWIEGRWPRGPIVVGHPFAHRPATLTLGIVAPLMPTRLALSEGPLPLHMEAVAHFRAAHDLIQSPGLAGCRLEIADGEMAALVARWPIDMARLPSAAEHWGVLSSAEDLLQPAVEGLMSGGRLDTTVILEARYTPDIQPSLTLEFGPIGLRSFAGLTSALAGDAAVEGLTSLCASLDTRGLHRARLTVNEGGLAGLVAVCAPKGESLKGAW